MILLSKGFAVTKLTLKNKAMKKQNKIKISFLDENGYKIYRYVTRLELSVISKFINLTVE
jgi:hypothetical protein